MKKSLIFIALFIISSKLMAQKSTVLPFDNTLNNKLLQPFKPDSAWRVNPPAVSTDKLFKQPDIDIKKIELDKKFNTMMAVNGAYKMPVIKTEGNSKMPVIKLNGNSEMPVVGKGNKTDQVIIVNP